MNVRLAILLLLLAAGPTGAADYNPNNFMLRWTPLQWTNWVRGLANTPASAAAQTNISYRAVTNAPWQWGTVNGTNWSTLPTNVLLDYVRWGDLTTNVAWLRVTNYTNTVSVPNALFDTNGTLFSWTADGGQYRIDTARLLTTPVLGQVNNYEHDIGVFWTNEVGERLDFLLSNIYSDGHTASSANFNEYLTTTTFLFRAPAGKLVTVTNHAVITSANGVGGTNYITMEVSAPRVLYGVSR